VTEMLIYEADLMLLLRGEAVKLDDGVAVAFSAILSIEHVAALVATELSARYRRQAHDAAVLPETRRHLSLAYNREDKKP
jgi:hypothetical protein